MLPEANLALRRLTYRSGNFSYFFLHRRDPYRWIYCSIMPSLDDGPSPGRKDEKAQRRRVFLEVYGPSGCPLQL